MRFTVFTPRKHWIDNRDSNSDIYNATSLVVVEKGIPMMSEGKYPMRPGTSFMFRIIAFREKTHPYPYASMKIGDSFKIMNTVEDSDWVQARVHAWMKSTKNTTGMRFTCRKGEDRFGSRIRRKRTYTRVWRMEDDPDPAMKR
jgi:hypothetical protein